MRDEDDPAWVPLPRDCMTQADADRLPSMHGLMGEAATIVRGHPMTVVMRRTKAAQATLRIYLGSEIIDAVQRNPADLDTALADGLVELLIERFLHEKPLYPLAPGWFCALMDLEHLTGILLASVSRRAESAIAKIKQASPRLVERMAKDCQSLIPHLIGTSAMSKAVGLLRTLEEAVFRPRGETLSKLAPASLQVAAACYCRATDFATQRQAGITIIKLSAPAIPGSALLRASFGVELEAVARIARSRVETSVRLIKPTEATYEDAARLARAVQMVTAANAASSSNASSLEELIAESDSQSTSQRMADERRLDHECALRRWAPELYIEAATRAFRMRRLRPELVVGADQAGDIYVVQAASLEVMSLALTETVSADRTWTVSLMDAGLWDMIACLTVCRTLTTPDAMARGLWTEMSSTAQNDLNHCDAAYVHLATIMPMILGMLGEDHDPEDIIAAMRPHICRLIPTVLARHLRQTLDVGPPRSPEAETLARIWKALAEMTGVAWPTQDSVCWCARCVDRSAKCDDEAKLRRCGRCRVACYESAEHQRLDWPAHRPWCSTLAATLWEY